MSRTLTITVEPDWKKDLRHFGALAQKGIDTGQYQGEYLNFATPDTFFGHLCGLQSSDRQAAAGPLGCPQRFALERDAVRTWQHPVEHGVGHGRLADPGMPVLDRHQAGQVLCG